jgi:hypothetical protein
MSGGYACRCSERDEPLIAQPGANRPARLWRVMQRYCNHSAFSGYRYVPSRYSCIFCLRCGACWRTTASFVAYLADNTEDEINISPGRAGYQEAMIAAGRTLYRS